MRPDERDLDEEIRGHLALEVRERIARGEDPDQARLSALREFGYVPAIRDSMRRVWFSRWLDAVEGLGRDVRVALRSLARARGLSFTVIVTLALGIGANAAVVGVVRAVLLRPLVNRDAERLIYIRQSAPGLGAGNTTFSVPEIADFRARATTFDAFGEFSTVDFTMVGFGEPRVVHAGVVNGTYFEVMGLRPVLGRLIGPRDDGPDAARVVVLTHRFWSTSLNRDPAVIGRTVRLGTLDATVVGVLEPSVPYPEDTEIVANVVTSPHHLGATMTTHRTHRMTEFFGRLLPGATLEASRAELTRIHAAMTREHPDAYPAGADMQVAAVPFREQITAPARPILLVLLAAAGLVFVIACANVANLILARSVRRESELAIRAALGAGRGALRRALLGESLVLCGAGALLGVLIARPLVALLGRYASQFSVRALDVTVDATLLWIGAVLALVAAVILAHVPRLPSPHAPAGLALAGTGARLATGTNRRLRAFAVTQIALSFVLLAGAGMLLTALATLQRISTGYDMRQVLALDVPLPIEAYGPASIAFFQEATRRVGALPGVERVAAGSFVPWRDAGSLGAGFRFAVDGHTPAAGKAELHARLRNVSPGLFGVLGVPVLAGRDFTEDDGRDGELVVIVSDSLARQLFPAGDVLHRRLWWTDPYFGRPEPRRIVGVVADADDENVVPGPVFTIYHPLRQVPFAGRLFVRAEADPYSLVAPVTRAIHGISAEQPVERAATLADVRAEALAPERLNATVFTAFAGVALLIAVAGVAGVLAFSVSARTREFGVRLAIGSSPRQLLVGVLAEGVSIAAIGLAAGAGAGWALGRVAMRHLEPAQLPGVLPILGAAAVLLVAAMLASLMPAARAARVDVLQALRSE